MEGRWPAHPAPAWVPQGCCTLPWSEAYATGGESKSGPNARGAGSYVLDMMGSMSYGKNDPDRKADREAHTC